MDAERCVCCGEVIPEGKMVCPNCEDLQSAKTENTDNICQWLFASLEDVIDMC